jgi:tetrahydromethanopterin S-methyltransferase subunit F
MKSALKNTMVCAGIITGYLFALVFFVPLLEKVLFN